MATQLQLRRGTSAENNNFTGAEAELTYDSTSKAIRVHDGATKGGITVAHMAAPSTRKVALTLPSNGDTVVAPGDGYIVFRKATSAANQYVELVNVTGRKYTGGFSVGPLAGSYCLVTCPVSKGDSVYVGYNAGGATDVFQFVYANGAA